MKRLSSPKITTLSTHPHHPLTQQKFDAKFMQMMLTTAFKTLQTSQLYSEDHNVMAEYQKLQYAIDALHTYLYERKTSHLTDQDAQIFANYLVQKMKDMQTVVDKIASHK